MYDRSKEYTGGGRGGPSRAEDRRAYSGQDRGYYRDKDEHRMDPRDTAGRSSAYYDPPARGSSYRGYDARSSGPYGGSGSVVRPKGGPRPWDYSRRPVPRTDEEHFQLENERRAWEMRERERWGPYPITQPYPDPPSYRRYPPEPRDRLDYSRDPGYPPHPDHSRDPYREQVSYSHRSRSPPRAGFREEGLRRSPPPEVYRPVSPPRAAGDGFISTPPTGPRGAPPSADRDREGQAGHGYFSPSHSRFTRPHRDQAVRPGASAANRWRDHASNDNSGHATPSEEDAYYRDRGVSDRHTASSPYAHPQAHASHSSPYHADIAHPPSAVPPRLSRTSSSENQPHSTTLAHPTPPSRHFSAGHTLCPDLDAELLAIEAQRSSFATSFHFGQPHSEHRNLLFALKDAELDHASALIKVTASEKALELAKESADAYSLEENRKEELLAQQQRLAV